MKKFLFLAVICLGCASSSPKAEAPMPGPDPNEVVNFATFCNTTAVSACVRANECGMMPNYNATTCQAAYYDGCCAKQGYCWKPSGPRYKLETCSNDLRNMACSSLQSLANGDAKAVPQSCNY